MSSGRGSFGPGEGSWYSKNKMFLWIKTNIVSLIEKICLLIKMEFVSLTENKNIFLIE